MSILAFYHAGMLECSHARMRDADYREGKAVAAFNVMPRKRQKWGR
jgi:hypothetical protein